jgi:hypothetical protein
MEVGTILLMTLPPMARLYCVRYRWIWLGPDQERARPPPEQELDRIRVSLGSERLTG